MNNFLNSPTLPKGIRQATTEEAAKLRERLAPTKAGNPTNYSNTGTNLTQGNQIDQIVPLYAPQQRIPSIEVNIKNAMLNAYKKYNQAISSPLQTDIDKFMTAFTKLLSLIKPFTPNQPAHQTFDVTKFLTNLVNQYKIPAEAMKRFYEINTESSNLEPFGLNAGSFQSDFLEAIFQDFEPIMPIDNVDMDVDGLPPLEPIKPIAEIAAREYQKHQLLQESNH